MFSNTDNKKNKEFVGKVQAARQHRAEEREKEKAAICIQVIFFLKFVLIKLTVDSEI